MFYETLHIIVSKLYGCYDTLIVILCTNEIRKIQYVEDNWQYLLFFFFIDIVIKLNFLTQLYG